MHLQNLIFFIFYTVIYKSIAIVFLLIFFVVFILGPFLSPFIFRSYNHLYYFICLQFYVGMFKCIPLADILFSLGMCLLNKNCHLSVMITFLRTFICSKECLLFVVIVMLDCAIRHQMNWLPSVHILNQNLILEPGVSIFPIVLNCNPL